MHIARIFFLGVHFVLFSQIINSHPLDERTLMCACSVMVSLNLFPSVRFPFGQHKERGLWPDPNWKSATHGLRSLQLNADWLTILNDFSARAEELGLARCWAEEKWSQGTVRYLCVSIVMRGREQSEQTKDGKTTHPTPPVRSRSILRHISRGF